MALERPHIDKPEGDVPFELGIEDLVVGDGAEATSGQKVTVHYVGVAFRSGEEFDASWNRGQPFEFKLGKGQVIPGWDAGVQGMTVGGRRRLTIPSAMAYGARGAGGVIEPHEPLVFVVDLLGRLSSSARSRGLGSPRLAARSPERLVPAAGDGGAELEGAEGGRCQPSRQPPCRAGWITTPPRAIESNDRTVARCCDRIMSFRYACRIGMSAANRPRRRQRQRQ